MAYTEIKETGRKKYYYRVRTLRNGKKFKKQRIYLGRDLSDKDKLLKEKEADKKLNIKKESNKINKLIPIIVKILKRYGIKKAGIFGSYIGGEQTKKSDIDILVEPPEGIGFKFVRIQFELENKLKKKIDLVSYNGLSPYLKNKILNQEVRII